jgi:hypothetical protein
MRTSTRRQSIIKGTLCLLIVMLTTTALTAESTAAHASLAASSLPVAASPASVSGLGPSFCSLGNGGGLSSSGVQLDNVYPCANPNIKDSFGWQCVEYSVRFESVVYGLPASWAGGPGAKVVNELNQHGIPVSSPNGSTAGSSSGPNLPAPGDVISMSGPGQELSGHTGVVKSVNVSNGTGTITYYDQNGWQSAGVSRGYDQISVTPGGWSDNMGRSFDYAVFNWTTQASWSGVGSAQYLGSDRLTVGQRIYPNHYLLSSNGLSVLILQPDGNLVDYSMDGKVLWASGTTGQSIGYGMMQSDGNFVLRHPDGTWAWATWTQNTPSRELVLQNDGNVVVYETIQGSYESAWNSLHHGGRVISALATPLLSDRLSATGATVLGQNQFLRSADGRYFLLLQSDGNLVLYGPGYHILWNSKTSGDPATQLIMQNDGNVALYNQSLSVSYFNTVTHGDPATQLVLQSDGNLVLYNQTLTQYFWTVPGWTQGWI